MKTIFTTNDIKNIMKNIFADNSEDITLTEKGESITKDLNEYLNIEFYAFKNNLVNSNKGDITYEAWLNSLNFTLKKSYALVEITDEEATISPDIDFVEKSGRITFIIQDNKANLLDYYIQKLRTAYMGRPEKAQNYFGETLNTYLLFGILQYDEEPESTQLGKTIVCSVGFKITYLTNALTYSDYNISLSLDSGANYYTIPITDLSMQVIFANDALPKYTRNDVAGILNKTSTFVLSMTFYDFIQTLTSELTDMFMTFCAKKKNGADISAQDINALVLVKISVGGNEYVYYTAIDNIQKKVENASYSSTAITLKGRASDVI